MDKTIAIDMAELAVASENAVITTGGIGSCIVIAVYDEEAKIGGLAHAILPSREHRATDVVEEARQNVSIESAAKYANEAVDKLVAEIVKLGGNKTRLQAKLVGGLKCLSFYRVIILGLAIVMWRRPRKD